MMLSAGNGFIMQSDKYSRDNAGQSLKKYTLLKKGELAYNHGASKAKQSNSAAVTNFVKKKPEYRMSTIVSKFRTLNTLLMSLWS